MRISQTDCLLAGDSLRVPASGKGTLVDDIGEGCLVDIRQVVRVSVHVHVAMQNRALTVGALHVLQVNQVGTTISILGENRGGSHDFPGKIHREDSDHFWAHESP